MQDAESAFNSLHYDIVIRISLKLVVITFLASCDKELVSTGSVPIQPISSPTVLDDGPGMNDLFQVSLRSVKCFPRSFTLSPRYLEGCEARFCSLLRGYR